MRADKERGSRHDSTVIYILVCGLYYTSGEFTCVSVASSEDIRFNLPWQIFTYQYPYKVQSPYGIRHLSGIKSSLVDGDPQESLDDDSDLDGSSFLGCSYAWYLVGRCLGNQS